MVKGLTMHLQFVFNCHKKNYTSSTYFVIFCENSWLSFEAMDLYKHNSGAKKSNGRKKKLEIEN